MTPTDQQLDAQLRSLDPAPRLLDEQQLRHKDELLASILAGGTASSDGPAAEPRPITSHRRGERLRWLVPVAAVGALVVAFAMPRGDNDAAYASWTKVAQPVSATAAAKATDACRDAIRDSLEHMSDPAVTTRADDMQPVVAERRGNFLFLSMAGSDGSTQQCFLKASKPDKVEGSTGGFNTTGAAPTRRLAGHQFEANGGGLSSGPEGSYTFVVGRVAPGVRSVVIHSGTTDVTATVNGQDYVAWWPIIGSSEGQHLPTPRYDLTLTDGTVLRNQHPLPIR